MGRHNLGRQADGATQPTFTRRHQYDTSTSTTYMNHFIYITSILVQHVMNLHTFFFEKCARGMMNCCGHGLCTDYHIFVKVVYSYFEKGCREKKISKCMRQDRKVVWVFTGILHISLKEIYKFVFLHVENLFFFSGAYICSFNFTVACLWVRKIILKFRGAKRTLFLHVWKERKPEIRTYFVVISH